MRICTIHNQNVWVLHTKALVTGWQDSAQLIRLDLIPDVIVQSQPGMLITNMLAICQVDRPLVQYHHCQL